MFDTNKNFYMFMNKKGLFLSSLVFVNSDFPFSLLIASQKILHNEIKRKSINLSYLFVESLLFWYIFHKFLLLNFPFPIFQKSSQSRPHPQPLRCRQPLQRTGRDLVLVPRCDPIHSSSQTA